MPKKLNSVDKAKLVTMLKDKETYTTIGKVSGINRNTVAKYVKEDPEIIELMEEYQEYAKKELYDLSIDALREGLLADDMKPSVKLQYVMASLKASGEYRDETNVKIDVEKQAQVMDMADLMALYKK